jgi:hypothetical protein
LRRSAIALIVLAIGIVVNFLVVMGIYAVPCTTPVPNPEEEEEQVQPAFGTLATCSDAHTAGFIILGLADAFAIYLVVSELAKRR